MRSGREKAGFGLSVGALLSGSAGAMAIAYVIQPMLTRLYGPEAYGSLDLFLSIYTLLLPVASFRYEDAMMLPERDEEALSLTWLAFLLMTGVSGIVAVSTLLLGDSSWAYGWAIWLAPAMFLARLGKIAEVWLVRKRRYGGVSQGQIGQAGAMAAVRLAGGMRDAGFGGLMAGFFVGQAVSTLYWIVLAFRNGWQALPGAIRWQEIVAMMRRFRRFPFYSTPSALLNALVTRLPFLLLAYYVDTTAVGYFGRAFAVLAVPLSLLGGAVSQVFFVEGAEAIRRGTLGGLTSRVHGRLVGLGLFPTLAAVLAGPELMAVVFGAPWREAGVYLQILAPWLFLASVASALTRVFDITERQRMDLASSAGLFVIQAVVLVVAGRSGDAYTMVWAAGIAGAVSRLAHIGLMMWLGGVGMGDVLAPYGVWGLRSLPFLAIVALTYRHEPAWMSVVGAAGAGAGYLAALYFHERHLHNNEINESNGK